VSDDPAAALWQLPPVRAVVLWHALEHLPNPAETVRAAAAALEPGGVLAVATPNPDAFQFRLLGARWTHVDAPRHLSLMPADALAARAREAGLELAVLTTDDAGGRFWNLFGWKRSLAPAGSGRARRLAATAVGAVLGRLPTEHGALRGSTYTAVFRKAPA